MRPSEADRERIIETRSPSETRNLGVRLAKALEPGTAIALIGDLGSGKTVFAQGVAEGLGCAGEVTSPTFALVNVYEGRLPVYHADFYRLSRPQDVESIGFRDYLDGRGVLLVEWADRHPEALPDERLEVMIRPGRGVGEAGGDAAAPDEQRTVRLRAYGEGARRLLDHL